MKCCRECHLISVRNKLHQRMEGVVGMNHLAKDDKIVYYYLAKKYRNGLWKHWSMQINWIGNATFHKEHGHKSSKVYSNINNKRYKRKKYPFACNYT